MLTVLDVDQLEGEEVDGIAVLLVLRVVIFLAVGTELEEVVMVVDREEEVEDFDDVGV